MPGVDPKTRGGGGSRIGKLHNYISLGICSNINVAEQAQKLRREQKREGEEVKEELITLQYLNSTHHRWVEFHIPFYII